MVPPHFTIVLYVCDFLWNDFYMYFILYMIMCMLLSATSTHFKWELMLYCLHCPTINKVFLLLVLLYSSVRLDIMEFCVLQFVIIRPLVMFVTTLLAADAGGTQSYRYSVASGQGLPSNLWYKAHKITKLKCFSSRLAVVFAQSIEAMC